MRTSLLAGGAAAGLTLAAAGALPAAAVTDEDAVLSVLHGVAGTPVDVYVDGELTLDDFEPGELAGPLTLPAGTYAMAITPADAVDASAPLIGPLDVALAAGGDYTAAAFLDPAGEPTAALFTNDTTATPAGEGRLTVRHLAVAPDVDLLADDVPVVTALANPDEDVVMLPAATVSAVLAETGSTVPLVGPTDIDVVDGVNTIVYAWGSAGDNTLDVAAQTVRTQQTAPAGVPSGQLGLADDSRDGAWLVGTGLVVAAGGAAALVLTRRRKAAEVRS